MFVLRSSRPRLEILIPLVRNTQRFRSTKTQSRSRPSHHDHQHDHQQSRRPDPQTPLVQRHQKLRVKAEHVIPFFEDNVGTWVEKPETEERLVRYGLIRRHAVALLATFEICVASGQLSKPKLEEFYALDRFADLKNTAGIDSIYSTIFFWWAALPENEAMLIRRARLDQDALQGIRNLVKAADMSRPSDNFSARQRQRKVIFHVGPTNSGKTYHALRALASAERGMYGGPLRLLAHEIWERLNTGQIVPLDFDPDSTSTPALPIPSPLTNTTLPPAARVGNPRHIRPTSLITGEEQRIVPNARLVSCTVEMMPTNREHDVAVIDEIQMIGDENRGSAWSEAVMGLNVTELHLCGEETAVPVVQNLLQDTGDAIEIRQYERLTPLVVEDESLNGDFSKVRKGDCVITFSRANIFAIRRMVEEQTGLRCAVVYGALPPEVRSEQAALFNDPESGFDVMVASDAVGMGLNLNIHRVIFETTSKFGHAGPERLPVSAVKQIGGRAGRFGMGSGIGHITSLYDEDLNYIRHCMDQPYKPLTHGHIGCPEDRFRSIMKALPPKFSMETLMQAPLYVGRFPKGFRYKAEHTQDLLAFEFIEAEWKDMSLRDKLLLSFAPIQWKEENMALIKPLLIADRDYHSVDLIEVIGDYPHFGALEEMEELMEKQKKEMEQPDKEPMRIKRTVLSAYLKTVETLHKVTVFYLWMSFKHPLVYFNVGEVQELKTRVEKALGWGLQNMSRRLRRVSTEPQAASEEELPEEVEYKPTVRRPSQHAELEDGEELDVEAIEERRREIAYSS